MKHPKSAVSDTFSRLRCVHELFEERVRLSPHAIAAVCRNQRLTYDQLNRRANQLAHALREAGVASGTLVAVYVDRSLEMIVALIAILKAGGAYVPLDPSYPARRLAFVLEDTRAKILLTQRSLRPLPVAALRSIYLDDEADLARFPDTNPAVPGDPEQLAYVIYTSGSTGSPKGVQIPHRGIVRLLFGVDYAHFGPSRVFLHLAPLSFDASTFEIWGALLHGGRCILYPELLPTIHGLQQALYEHQVTTLWLTAGLYNTIIDEAPDILRNVEELLIGGEALSIHHVQRGLILLPNTQIINGYGPTECTTFACCYRIPRTVDPGQQSVPIGRAIGRTQTYILDQDLRPVHSGQAGELFIGGDGLATGYLNAPEVTAERFLDVPLNGSSVRVYRTGDLVRCRSDGEIEFLGRMDHQVKIRGFRIEIPEVEIAVAALPCVRQCAVVCQEDSPGNKRLIAYVVSVGGVSAFDADELRSCLKMSIPAYMIPSVFVPIEALPLTVNGKVDRAALSAPPAPVPSPRQNAEPQTDTQRLLLDVWRNLFGTRDISLDDDFFLIGGDSLMAVRLVAEIDRRARRCLPLEVLSHARTITQLAAVLDSNHWQPPCSHLVPIQPSGSHPPLFCVPGLGGHAFMFHELSQALGPDYPVFAMQLADSNSPRSTSRSIEEIAAHCIRDMQSVQPRGPYQLLGYSLGGTVVFEMAQQLRAEGEEVSFLGLLDSDGPDYPRLASAAHRAWLHLRHMIDMDRPQRISYLVTRLRNLWRKVSRSPAQFLNTAAVVSADSPVAHEIERTASPLYRAWLSYKPQFYPESAVVLSAATKPAHLGMDYSDVQMGWRAVVPRIDVNIIPGSHSDLHHNPHVNELAAAVRQYLAILAQTPRQIRRPSVVVPM